VDSDSLEIRKIGNGAILKDSVGEQAYLFDEGSVEGLVSLLREIAALIGTVEDRYAMERISISIVHGDKYECDGCAICKVQKEGCNDK